MPEPRISVVIPTRDRAASLRLCLAALVAQLDPEFDEAIVVDDGSADETASLAVEFPSVIWLRQESLGTCAARNQGVAAANGEVVLFIDDDVVCSPGLITKHRDFHRLHSEMKTALGGLVTWDPTRPISKHMLWLEDGGPLFAFNTIEDFEDVDPRHFCTSNVSVKRQFLASVDGPFDVRIRRFTDVELGLRLASEGMVLHFDPDAIGWHLRSDTPATTDQRMFDVGKASVLLDQIHPGIAPHAAPRTATRATKAALSKLLSPIAPLLPHAAADRIWASRAAWAYSAGREEAGR